MRSKLIFFCVCISSCIVGALVFAFHQQLIIVRIPFVVSATSSKISLQKKNIKYTYWKDGVQQNEWRLMLWSDSDITNARAIVRNYWSLLEENGILSSKGEMQAFTTDKNQSTLVCSLSTTPFNPEKSTYHSWLILEGLFATLREFVPRFQEFWLLIHHQPVSLSNLEFSRPWPMEGFYASALLPSQVSDTKLLEKQNFSTKSPFPYTIVLSPSGDARHPGRTIGDSFEKSVCWQFVHELKERLNKKNPYSKVVETHRPADIIEPLHKAAYANQLSANLYIHVSMYEEDVQVPEVSFYTFRWHPTTDGWRRQVPDGSFVRYSEAHTKNALLSSAIAQYMFSYIAKKRPFPATAKICVPLPYTPLLGIVVPAVAIEIGFNPRHTNCQELIDPFVELITQLVTFTPGPNS